MTTDPTIKRLNRKRCVLNWLAVIRNQRIIKDVFLVVVVILLVVWVIFLKGGMSNSEYISTQADIIEQKNKKIKEQKIIIEIYQKDILMYQDAISNKDGIIIIGSLEPPESVK